MSTYYYVACHDHKVKAPAFANAREDRSYTKLTNDEHLRNFLVKHRKCERLQVISEHYEPYYETVVELPVPAG